MDSWRVAFASENLLLGRRRFVPRASESRRGNTLMKKSWKPTPKVVPRFLQAAIRKGLKIADSIGIEEAHDKTWLTIKFTKKI